MRAIQPKLNQLQLNQPYILPIMTKFFLQTLSSVVTINLVPVFQNSVSSKQAFSPLTTLFTYINITNLVQLTVDVTMFTNQGLATVFHPT